MLPVLRLAATLFAVAFIVAPSPLRAASVPLSSTMIFDLAGNGGNCNGCEWISGQGPITARTPDDFETFLKNNGDLDGRETVMLNSNGGNLVAGLELGERIRNHKMGTDIGATIPDTTAPPLKMMVPGHCYSACAYAFLGGIKRSANPGDLGFHQFMQPATVQAAINALAEANEQSSDQEVMGLLVLYLKEMGIDPELVALASAAEPSTLYLPGKDEMTRLGVTNDAVSFSGWTIEAYGDGAIVTGTIKGAWLADEDVTFFCRTSKPGIIFMVGSYKFSVHDEESAAQHSADLRGEVEGTSLVTGSTILRQNTGLTGLSNVYIDNTGRYFFVYPMSGGELAQAIYGHDLHLEIATPEVENNPSFEPPIGDLGPDVSVAARSCL